MSRCDHHLTDEQVRLKRASREAASAFATHERAGEWLGYTQRPQQRVQERCSPNTLDFFTIEEARMLDEQSMERSGTAPIVEAMARAQGFALLPTLNRLPGSGKWHDRFAALLKEHGEAATKLAQALGDGTIDAVESRRLDLVGELDQLIGEAATLRAMLVQLERGDAE